jgi:hypothetical protein
MRRPVNEAVSQRQEGDLNVDWAEVIAEIEDHLAPHLKLNVWERVLYYHLLRQTHLVGAESRIISLTELAVALDISDWKARELVRSLDRKGCLVVEDRSQKGHHIRVRLPSELEVPRPSESADVSIDQIDFFSGRTYLAQLLARESERCFYCLREIDPETCALDHVNPQVESVDNSFRNIVAACHTCNSRKQGASGEDFLRTLLRNNLLSEAEFHERLSALEALKDGKLVPKL